MSSRTIDKVLQVHQFPKVYQIPEGVFPAYREFYLKEDVDKLIADLKAGHYAEPSTAPIHPQDTKFYVIAAVVTSNDQVDPKFWKSKPDSGEWVTDVAKAKHYATAGAAWGQINKKDGGYLKYLGMVPMIQHYGDNVRFTVLEVTATVAFRETTN